MRVVFDIECNALEKPDKIWLIVAKDIDTDELHIFRNITDDEVERKRFSEFSLLVSCWIGHNILGYDIPVLQSHKQLVCLHGQTYPKIIDTLIVSKLSNYPRERHSIEDYGLEFNFPKGEFKDFSKYSLEMEEYCVRDVEICHRVYNALSEYISNPAHQRALVLEHQFQVIVNELHDNGFAFDTDGAVSLRKKVERQLEKLDREILTAFPPRQVLVREFTPKLTKHGTISLTSVPRNLHHNICNYVAGQSYPVYNVVPFNPASHKQIIDVLHEAGWKPVNKTDTHKDLERLVQQSQWRKNLEGVEEAKIKLVNLKKYGWKVDEENINTLPDTAPLPARTLAKRILLEARRRTLTEWLGLVKDGRIHSEFSGIGAWTMRMATRKPNVQNIPRDDKLYGKEMRAFWMAPKGRLLCGVDADSIQFRIAAHYINDKELIRKIIEGKKKDKTDPHSYNMRVIGPFCKYRNDAKQTLFSLILGGGVPKLAEIMKCTKNEAEQGRDNLYKEYPGLLKLKNEIVVEDAHKGWFSGIDGRKILIPGDTFSNRKHLCPSGYLQSGEGIVMKYAAVKWYEDLADIKDLWKFVNLIHDENQTEGPNNMKIMIRIAKTQADAIRWVGEQLNLNCPLAGSYWSEDTDDYTIGHTWKETH